MASISLIKRRIQTAQNVSKTTRAMQMIATSKLKRAQDAAIASRPYVDKLTLLSKRVAEIVDPEIRSLNEYMKLREEGVKLLITISPDKGLCGSLVTNLLKELLKYGEVNKNAKHIVIGKKAENTIVKLGKEIIASFEFGTTLPIFEVVFPIVKLVNEQFLEGKVFQVDILYTNFHSVFSQKPNFMSLLPVKFSKEESELLKDKKNELKNSSAFTIFEPEPNELLPHLLSHYLEMSLYQFMLESYASEQAARMIAMKNATENAYEIIDYLKLEYNKKRQEKITNEILDIGGGAIVLDK